MSASFQPTCTVIRSKESYEGKQGLTYFAGISAQSAGAKAICLHLLTFPPGGRARAHLHENHETAIYVLSGQAEMWYGEELQDYLSAVYSKTVKGAAVTVIIREIRSRPIYFVGGFGKPGAMQLTRDLTLLQAIALVGGVTQGADAEKGFVLRKDKQIPVDFFKLTQKGDLTQNIKLEPGDSIVVPVADLVYVQGEVRAPGGVKYTQDLTLVRAITQAGGLTQMAAGGRVDILRGRGEKKERIRVDVDKMMRAGDGSHDVLVKPDDIILVPQRLF